jgi:photosystem II stability/assembly factor-like uncharacterized protein
VKSPRGSRGARLAAFVALLAIAGASPLRAQDKGWVLQGEGGLVTALVLDPTDPAILYATTARGIFKTIDGGATWRPQGGVLDGKSILAMAIDPRKNTTIFATTDTGGVYRSKDGGDSWTEANHGLPARYVGSIAVDPASTIWAGTEAGRIFKSGDGGDSWTETVPPTASISVMAIAPDPVKPGTVYIGTNSEGVYKTIDGGATWTHLTKGLKRATVWNILVDKSSPSTIYAGTHEGFYKSSDGGAYWTPGNRGLTSFNILALAVDPQVPSTLYAGTASGVFATADGGGSWRPLYPDLYATAIALDPSAPSTVYAGTHLGVMKTQDRGTRWSPLRLAAPPEELAEKPKPLPPLPFARARATEDSLPKLPVVVRNPEGRAVPRPQPVIAGPKEAPASVLAVNPAKDVPKAPTPSAGGGDQADRLASPSPHNWRSDPSRLGPNLSRPWDLSPLAGFGDPNINYGVPNPPERGAPREPGTAGQPGCAADGLGRQGETRTLGNR